MALESCHFLRFLVIFAILGDFCTFRVDEGAIRSDPQIFSYPLSDAPDDYLEDVGSFVAASFMVFSQSVPPIWYQFGCARKNCR